LSPERSFSPCDKLFSAYKNSTRPVIMTSIEVKTWYAAQR
jgi:hypothetical protein